jgi:acyl-CoA thioesterase-1
MVMVRRSILLTSLLVSLFLLNSCGQSEPASSVNENEVTEESTSEQVNDTPQKKDRPRIVFFGNSLTAGYGLDEQYSFPSLIQQRLDSLGYSYEVVNAGLSGETTAGGRNRIDWVMEQPMDIFVLELGGNDVLRGFDLEVTRKNLAAILDAVRKQYPEVKLVLAGMEAPPNMGNTYTKEFRKIYQDLAREKNTALIPFLLADVGGIESLNLPDRIHPNKEGQKIVASNVMKTLVPLLEMN